jgi:hypothetical protein
VNTYLPDLPAAAERLAAHVAAGTVLRGKWRYTSPDGRERACLLAALSPSVQNDPSQCPASVLPAWLAYLTPSIDDNGTLEAWPGVVAEYARLVVASPVLDAAAWHRLDYRMRLIALDEAAARTDDERALCAVVDVMALCQREIDGAAPSAEDWTATARSAAAYAAYAAAAAYAADAAADASCVTAATAATARNAVDAQDHLDALAAYYGDAP